MLSARGILFFGGTVLVGLSAEPRIHIQSVEAMVRSAVIPKTAVSDNFRLVFLAGLEGSGHHYFRGVGEAIKMANPDLPLIHHHLDVHPFYLPVCMGESASSYAEAEREATAGIRTLVKLAAHLPGPTFYLPKNTLSYPQNGGPGKVLQYSDLRMVAQAAEMEGVDLRVVYLKRSARDMIIANTVHRQFQM